MTPEELRDFETEIEKIYETGVIRGPVHLRNGYEERLLEIAEDFQHGDVFFSTWASHLHALAAGIPAEKVKEQILDGRSITLCFPEYNFYTSAIVGGIAPIAVGAALDIKYQNDHSPCCHNNVWCFIGDMAYFTGIVQESIRYARMHDLPLTFVVEDNKKSVCTPTEEVWGESATLDLNFTKKSK